MDKIQQQTFEIYGDKTPICVHCGKDAVLADQQDVINYKTLYDVNYPLAFIFVGQCECWLEHDEWLGTR